MGTTIFYDEFGIPHIAGETREDLAFGADGHVVVALSCLGLLDGEAHPHMVRRS